MIIRDFTVNDKQHYIDMAKDFYSSEATLYNINESKLNKTFEQIINKSPHIRGLILEENNQIIGYGLITFIWICESGGLTVWLDELYIKENFRNKGYGSKYFEWVFNKYNNNDISFRLEVCSKNLKVKKLYESFGFKELNYIQMVKNYNTPQL